MKEKRLFTFTVDRDHVIEKEEKTLNDAGEEVITKKKVTEKQPITYTILKPTRTLRDEAELYSNIQFSEAVNRGMLTKALLAKRYRSQDGAFSEKEKNEWAKMYPRSMELERKIQEMSLKRENLNQQEKDSLEELLVEYAQIQSDIQNFEIQHSSLFDRTAETFSRNMTIRWWVLFLLHEIRNEELIPFFRGDTYEEKIAAYDIYDELEDEFFNSIINKVFFLVTLWFTGRISNEKEFQSVYDGLVAEETANLEEPTEEEVTVDPINTEEHLERRAEEETSIEEKPTEVDESSGDKQA